MNEVDVLLKPVLSERATEQQERYGKYTFVVNVDANKHHIARAITNLYGVEVTGVRTLNVRGKVKRRGNSIGRRSNWKKAIVDLKSGDNIDFFAMEVDNGAA